MLPVPLQVIALLGAAAAAGGITYALHPAAPALYAVDEPLAEGETTVGAVREKWGVDGVLWIDARPEEKFALGHVAGARSLSLQNWDDFWFDPSSDALLAGEKPVVVYCGTLACQSSKKVAAKLRGSVGLDDVFVLRGGWKSLVDAGLAEE